MSSELRIIVWPDPRLKKVSEPIQEFTPALRELASRMIELMRQHKGVGLAAAQVGHNIRMFVMNPTGEPNDNRIYVNPVLSEPQGEETSEEGCLSLPGVNAQISRDRSIHMKAFDLEGQPIEDVQSGYIARIWQHEYDHLNGVLITDRMGLGDRFKHRGALKELREACEKEHPLEKDKGTRRQGDKGKRNE